MLGSIVSVDRLIKEKVKENSQRGGYNPNIPGAGSILDLSTIEYLEAFGQVQDNRTKKRVPFRVDGVNENITLALLGYMDDPGYDEDGMPYWHVQVGRRQSTKSTGSAFGLYATTAHNTQHWDYSTGFRCCADL